MLVFQPLLLYGEENDNLIHNNYNSRFIKDWDKFNPSRMGLRGKPQAVSISHSLWVAGEAEVGVNGVRCSRGE